MRKLFIMLVCLWLGGCTQPAKPTVIEGKVVLVALASSMNLSAIGVETPRGIEKVIVVGKGRAVAETTVRLRKARSLHELDGKRVKVWGLREPNCIVATFIKELL